ncbi:MAG: glucosamine-6-phosphate deaminase [Cyanosarcina radialis HA8281-LM2]|jgi:glucosamine-6-phosphate deaminase|nr:glucosamine-6-phosphate deaminase [Cyanosarcina radialis HA8281-LM2]
MIANSLADRAFQVDALSVLVYRLATEMFQDAALQVQNYLQQKIAQQGTATVVLATGNSQIEFLDTLINFGTLDWSKITFFHLDEYLGIEPNHPASFQRYLRERVEKRVNPAAFHYLQGDAMQPLDECDRYSQLLQAQAIDLCCLGIGENGHLAFNDPPVADFQDPRSVKIVKLDEANRQQQAKQGHFLTLEAVPQYAYTLTISAICAAEKIVCLAPEKRKAAIVKSLLKASISSAVPASVLRTQPQATLFLDLDAASLL